MGKLAAGIVFCSLIGLTAEAQSGRRVHLFQSQVPVPVESIKFIHAEIHSLDANGIFSLDGRWVKVGLDPAVHPSVIRAALDRATGGSFSALPAEIKSMDGGDNSVPYPVFVDTGNPQLDLQNYTTAKENWQTAYPELNQGADSNVHR